MNAAGDPLVEEVLSGTNPGLERLAAEGLLPLAPTLLVPLQVALAGNPDAEVARLARESIRTADPRMLAAVLEEEAGEEVLTFCAQHVEHPLVLETVLRRRDTPRWLLAAMAPRLSPELQELLLLRQDAIVEEPGILDALAGNPGLSAFARRRIGEYREHLLGGAAEAARAAAVAPEITKEVTQDEFERALAAARAEPASGEVDEVTGLAEGQIRTLPVPVRLKLSRGASRTLRGILVRDQNPMVALSVLANNPISDSEVEQIAASRAVVDDVLYAIARNREWVRKYQVVNALVRNPRTPVAVAVRLVPKLSVRDLRNLGRDRNVSDAVRSQALRLYKMKSK